MKRSLSTDISKSGSRKREHNGKNSIESRDSSDECNSNSSGMINGSKCRNNGSENTITAISTILRNYDLKNKYDKSSDKSSNDTREFVNDRCTSWGAKEDQTGSEVKIVDEVSKEKANFGLSGALAKDAATGNISNGVVLKFSEPLDACVPNIYWRLYVFKNDDIIETLHIHRKSVYLFGRDNQVADVVLQHPSCSKQHAVIQYRNTADKLSGFVSVKPYLMDLGSLHKTFLNGTVLDDARYYELREKDCINFGGSSREYVLLLST